jgi:hypothetical protein
MKLIDKYIPHLGLYMYSVAAHELSIEHRLDEVTLLGAMAEAIRNGTLVVRDPKTGAYFQVDKTMDNPSPYLLPEDLNDWLKSCGYPFQWKPISETNKVVSLESNESVSSAMPQPLIKRTIATAFADLHFDRAKWIDHLGDPPKWLESCRVQKGSKGKRTSATWDPTEIGIALLDKNVSFKALDAVFIGLKEWRAIWIEKTEILR